MEIIGNWPFLIKSDFVSNFVDIDSHRHTVLIQAKDYVTFMFIFCINNIFKNKILNWNVGNITYNE